MVEGSKLLFSSSVRVSPPIKDNSKRNNCSFIACRSVSLVNVDYGLEEFFMSWTFSGKYAPPSHAFTWLRFVPSFHPHLMIKKVFASSSFIFRFCGLTTDMIKEIHSLPQSWRWCESEEKRRTKKAHRRHSIQHPTYGLDSFRLPLRPH